MKVKQPFYLWAGVLLTLPLAYFLVDRIDFVRSSRTAMSTVESVSASNGRCGGKRRYDCTKFEATLKYRVDGRLYLLRVSAGSVRGHNQPLHEAQHHTNQLVQIAYDARRPGRAYRDTVWDVWGTPLLTFIFQICAFVGSLTEPRGGSSNRLELDRSYLAARSAARSRRR